MIGRRSRTWSRTARLTLIPPGSANALHPRCNGDTVAVNQIAVRDHIAHVDGEAETQEPISRVSAPCSGIARWIAIAQRTGSTTLLNSTSRPSPIVRTMRPPRSAIVGSTTSWRTVPSAASVPSSSRPASSRFARAAHVFGETVVFDETGPAAASAAVAG